ncbi:MAG: alpha/beta fold hydrolase [Gammaproteobacteria bacterium]
MHARHERPATVPAPYRLATLPSGIHVPYVDSGTGEPVLFVHGSLCDQRYWDSQTSVLAAQFRCIALSLSHYWPLAGEAAEGEFGWRAHVDQLAAFIRTLGGGPVHLVGHSRGAGVAFQLPRHHPQLVRTLTLADPGGPLADDASPTPAAVTDGLHEKVIPLIGAGAIEAALELFVDAVSMPGIWRRSPPGFRAMAMDNASTLPKQLRDPLPAYTRAAAEQVRCPALLIAGAASPPIYRHNVEALSHWLASAQTRIMLGASHGMNFTHAAQFNRLLAGFLSSQASDT